MSNWKHIFEQAEALRAMPELTGEDARAWVVAEFGVTSEEAGRLIFAGMKKQIVFKSAMRTVCGVDCVWRPGTSAPTVGIGSSSGGRVRVNGNSQVFVRD